MQVFDEDKQPIAYTEQGQPGFSWLHRIFFAAYNAMKNKGGSVDSPSMNPTWLRSIESVTDVGWYKVFIPMGPWRYGALCSLCTTLFESSCAVADNERDRVVAEMLRANCLAFISGMGPLLLRYDLLSPRRRISYEIPSQRRVPSGERHEDAKGSL